MSHNQERGAGTEHVQARWVKAQTLAEMLEISTRTLHRKVARGEFPRPVKIGNGSTRWSLRDVEAFLAKSRANHR